MVKYVVEQKNCMNDIILNIELTPVLFASHTLEQSSEWHPRAKIGPSGLFYPVSYYITVLVFKVAAGICVY